MKKYLIAGAVSMATLLATCSGKKASEGPASPAQSGTEEPWFFIQMSDPQLGFLEDNAGLEKDARLMRQAVDIVNRLQPDFVVITGDFVNASRNEEQLREFKRLVRGFDRKIPVHMIPGNHDISDTDAETSWRSYIKNYGCDRFEFTHKGCSMIGINTVLVKNGMQPAEAEQFRRLRRQLDKARDARLRFVFTHHSPFVKEAAEADGYSNFQGPMRRKYVDLFKEMGVNAVFSGHLHNNIVARDGDLQVFTCGPVGRPLGKGFSGMHLVKVYPDRFEADFIALDDFPRSVEF